MLHFPKDRPTLLCRKVQEGFGYKQECLSPSFRILEDGKLYCEACTTEYTYPELKAINAERRNPEKATDNE